MAPGISQLLVVAALSLAQILPLSGGAHAHLVHLLGSATALGDGVTILAVSAGLLVSLLLYFCVDLWEMGVGLVRAAKGKRDPAARLALQLLAATVPVAAIVLALPFAEVQLPAATAAVLGWASVVGGAFLFLLDRMSMTIKRLEHASYIDMLVVALAQVVAFLVPGVGRSAITMTFARALGYERVDSARFSFLLAIPAIAGWCVLQAVALSRTAALVWQPALFAVAGVSALSGLVALALMMAWLRRHSFAPFAIYRIVIGGTILALSWQAAG